MALRERILVYGGPGTGKSRGWLSIARMFPKVKVWVLDTDDAAERMIASHDLPNITVFPCLDWPDYLAAAAEARDKLDPDDWLVVDMVSSAWDAVQGFYIEQAFGMKLALESGPQGGLPVEAVEAGGPAANVGVEVGDRIVAVGDESVWHVYQLIEIINRWVSASPGLPLLVEREGEYRVLVFRSSGPLPLPGEEDGHQH